MIVVMCVQIPDMLNSRGSHACAVFDDKLYAIGGYAALKPLVHNKSVLFAGTMCKDSQVGQLCSTSAVACLYVQLKHTARVCTVLVIGLIMRPCCLAQLHACYNVIVAMHCQIWL